MLRDLTGETGPLLEAIRDGLGRQRDRHSAALAARSIDPPEWLVPALKQALAADHEDQQTRALVARTLCEFGADKGAVLAVITELGPDPRRGPGRRSR